MSPIEAKALTCLKQAEELEGALQNYERAASPRLAKSLQGIGSFLTLLYATLGRPLTGAGRAELATKTTAKRDDAVQSLSWFFVGDLIDWLRDHDRVTGVGRATCELWLSTLQYQKSALFAPCVEAGDRARSRFGVAARDLALCQQQSRRTLDLGDIGRAYAACGDRDDIARTRRPCHLYGRRLDAALQRSLFAPECSRHFVQRARPRHHSD